MSEEKRDSERLMKNLDKISLFCELESASKRHSVLSMTKKHLQDIVEGNTQLDWFDPSAEKLGIVRKIISTLDDLQEGDSNSYFMPELFQRLGLDVHHSEFFDKIDPLVSYAKQLMDGVKSPEVPRFKRYHHDIMAKELCGLLKQASEEYEKNIIVAVHQAFKRLDRGYVPTSPGNAMAEKLYELAVAAEQNGVDKVNKEHKELVSEVVARSIGYIGQDFELFDPGKSMKERVLNLASFTREKSYGLGKKDSEKEMKRLEAKVKKYQAETLSERAALAIFYTFQAVAVGGVVYGVSRMMPNSEDYVKALVTAACSIPVAAGIVGSMVGVAELCRRYIKRGKDEQKQ